MLTERPHKKEVSVLLLEDEMDICLMFSRIFKKKEIPFKCAYTLEEGKKAIKEFKPDVLLLDNNLPDGYGMDWITWFKSSVPDLKVVLITADALILKKENAEKADEIILKPTSFSKVLEVINSF